VGEDGEEDPKSVSVEEGHGGESDGEALKSICSPKMEGMEGERKWSERRSSSRS
jgi:hypothetical protein